MKRITTILAIILLGIGHSLSACECPEYRMKELDSISYKANDLVLIGKVVSMDQNGFEIEVKRVYKGTTQTDQLIVKYSFEEDTYSICSFYPNYKTDYLLYLTSVETENGTRYFASQCEANRSLDLRQTPPTIYNADQELRSWTDEWIEEIKKK